MQFRPLVLAAALFITLPVLAADGASASGSAWGDFQIGCTTCPHIPIPLTGVPDQIVAGAPSAFVSYIGGGVSTAALSDYTVGGGAAYAASAGFEGVLGLPVLKAEASANNEWAYIIADPDVPVGIDLYQSIAMADTTRRYQYTGSAPASFTFNFGVDGMVSGELASVFASAAIYNGSDPVYFETGLIDFDSVLRTGVGFGATPSSFADSFSVTVNVMPGDVFYLRAHLSALADMSYEPNDVFADAFDTLRVSSVTGGDTSLLLAGPVPEPGPAVLLALGLLSLALLRRRQA